MKHLFVALALLCANSNVMAQSTDSIVQFRTQESSFTDKSPATTDKRHYDYLPVNMRAGDEVLIEYSSSDFVVALMVRDTLGHEGSKQDDTTFFRAIGSKLVLPFKAPADGPYYFVFLSREANKTGKYKVNMFYYNAHNLKITSASSFCDKLKYIAGSSYTGFEFLKGQEKKSIMGGSFTASINLLPDATNDVSHNVGDTYTAAYASSADRAAMNKKFDELERNITSCLPDHTKKVFTVATASDFEKKDFVRKVEFTLSGSYPKDLNANHILDKIKDKVVLKLDKDGTKFRLKVEVE